MAKDTVTIALNGEVPLSAFADAVQRFRALVEALSAEVGPKVKIQWFVEDLQVSSAVATARGQAEETEVVERVVRAYAAVGHALERHETIPYSKKVAEQALSITTVLDGTVRSIRFETPDEDATIESPSAKRSNATSKVPAAYGAIEGRVQTLTSRNSLRFTLYDTLNDRAVSGYLEDGKEELMRGAWGRLAVVEGLVNRDADTGRATAVRKVRRVELLPELEPGGYRAARALLPLGSDDPAPEEAIRRLRDA